MPLSRLERAGSSPMNPMELTHKDVTQIIEMIDRSEHLDEVEVVFGEFRLHVQRSNSGRLAPLRSVEDRTPHPINKPTASIPDSLVLAESEVAVRAPMLGSFYRAPAPGEKPFVEVGQRVRADDTVCLIEVMKLLSTIRAGVDGTITRILVENGHLVEFGQALIIVSRGV
jgi:acetyl-CoA carboxylase biotin carboxyl carrier protein